MFLIERLPKESDGKSGGGSASFDAASSDRKTILENSLKRNIDIQLNAAWTPQYCKKFGVRQFGNLVAIQASNIGFLPENLNVPHVLCPDAPNGKDTVLQSPARSVDLILMFVFDFQSYGSTGWNVRRQYFNKRAAIIYAHRWYTKTILIANQLKQRHGARPISKNCWNWRSPMAASRCRKWNAITYEM